MYSCKIHSTESIYTRPSGKSDCRLCKNKRITEKRKKIKLDAGGKCTTCGYDKCLEALEWHHLDETKKEFSIRDLQDVSKARLEKELEKCVLLCANCHREVHAKMR